MNALSIFLVINFLIEGLLGLGLIFAPGKIMPTDVPLTLFWIRNYGFAAFTMGTLGLLFIKVQNEPGAALVSLGALSLFHLGLTIGTGLGAARGLAPIPIPVLHGLMAAGFIFFFLKRPK